MQWQNKAKKAVSHLLSLDHLLVPLLLRSTLLRLRLRRPLELLHALRVLRCECHTVPHVGVGECHEYQ